MIEEFKRADGRGLGFEKLGEKVGENSGESVYERCVESNPEFEVIGDIHVPLPKAPKNSFTPKPTTFATSLTQPKIHPNSRRLSGYVHQALQEKIMKPVTSQDTR
jgi:hypothetical protein